MRKLSLVILPLLLLAGLAFAARPAFSAAAFAPAAATENSTEYALALDLSLLAATNSSSSEIIKAAGEVEIVLSSQLSELSLSVPKSKKLPALAAVTGPEFDRQFRQQMEAALSAVTAYTQSFAPESIKTRFLAEQEELQALIR